MAFKVECALLGLGQLWRGCRRCVVLDGFNGRVHRATRCGADKDRMNSDIFLNSRAHLNSVGGMDQLESRGLSRSGAARGARGAIPLRNGRRGQLTRAAERRGERGRDLGLTMRFVTTLEQVGYVAFAGWNERVDKTGDETYTTCARMGLSNVRDQCWLSQFLVTACELIVPRA
jgi:hypothetical protein